MKALAVRRDATAALAGAVLCHDLRDEAGALAVRKGARLEGATLAAALAARWDEVHVLVPEAGDLHEEVAGARLARAVAGDGVRVAGYAGGQWTLIAARRGLLAVEVATLARLNAHEGVSIFTLLDGQPVEPGEAVARAKVTPLLIPEATVEAVEALAGPPREVLRVRGFRPATIGALAHGRLDAGQRARFEAALREKLDWFGARMLPLRHAPTGAPAAAEALRGLVAEGGEVLVVAGAGALDPLDPVFAALAMVGARMVRHGAPAHPGSLFWVASWDGRPVLGMPTCGMFSQATTFDLVLPRLLAGDPVDARAIAALGHGGLLSRDMAYRFPAYRRDAGRGEVRAP